MKFHCYTLILFYICSNMLLLFGQNVQNFGLEDQDKVIRLPETFIVETQIDPKTYILGPGDKIGLSIITNANLAYVMTIGPMGELWIPDIGAVHISGMDIKSAENHIAKFIHENRFKSAAVSLVLMTIRHFKIQVVGAVVSPGFVNVSSIERLSDAIKKSGGLHKLANEDNIIIAQEMQTDIKCSLRTLHLDGNLENNPVLTEGDVIHVSYKDEYKQNIISSISHKGSLVFVTGFVVRPAGHKFISGYTSNDYIAMSGGITDFGNLKKVVIYRNDELIPLSAIANLEPGDQINIPANMKYRMLGNMSMFQTLTAMMTLYLTYQAAIN